MTRIRQVCPEIRPGAGVEGVALALEREWTAQGIDVRRFTLAEAKGGWLPAPGDGLRGRAALAARVVWFSLVGSAVLRREARRDPVEVTVTHNDVLAGEVYVNHGLVQIAMRERGGYWWRMTRNPLHLFIAGRDRWRYTTRGPHRLVVNLVEAEQDALRRAFPRLGVPTVVIGNGVDTQRFRPPTDLERHAARAALGAADDEQVVAFIGHEHERKGLPLLLQAMAGVPHPVRLVVAGGPSDVVARSRQQARELGIDERVRFLGPVPDVVAVLHAADVLAQPSAYESFGLVVLEALACGVPVVSTRVGCAPDVLTDSRCGALVEPAAPDIAHALVQVRSGDRDAASAACRSVAEQHTWSMVAKAYLDTFRRHLGVAPGTGPGAPR